MRSGVQGLAVFMAAPSAILLARLLHGCRVFASDWPRPAAVARWNRLQIGGIVPPGPGRRCHRSTFSPFRRWGKARRLGKTCSSSWNTLGTWIILNKRERLIRAACGFRHVFRLLEPPLLRWRATVRNPRVSMAAAPCFGGFLASPSLLTRTELSRSERDRTHEDVGRPTAAADSLEAPTCTTFTIS